MSNSKLKSIKITADSELRDLLPGYLKNRIKDAEALRLQLEQNDFKSIERITHKIKGSAGSYGFTELGEIGGKMEKAAQENDLDALKKLYAEMSEYLGAVDLSDN
jgi:HPt (histidine-containing phosphotransfer) domain-containing protein